MWYSPVCGTRFALRVLLFLAVCLSPLPAWSAPLVYFSTEGAEAVPGVAGPFDDADIYVWDGAIGTFSRVFDASEAGFPGNADIDGLHVQDSDTFFLSFSKNKGTKLPDLGNVQDEDIILYDAGVVSYYLDGSDAGLSNNAGEDVDALHVLDDGSVVVSTTSSPDVSGVSGLDDKDLMRCTGSFGVDTTCTWSLYFDGSDAGLTDTDEDLDAVAIHGNAIVLSTLGSFDVAGLSGNKEDVFQCPAATTGPDTACDAYTMLLDGDAYGLADNIDAISVTGLGGGAPVLPTAVDDPGNSTDPGTPLDIDVLANDLGGSAPIDPATVAIADPPLRGSATPLIDGTVRYVPAAGETGDDSFTYTVNDEQGRTSNLATVRINIALPGGGDPGIVSLISPSGVITTRMPAYTWQADPNATRYRLRVNDASGTKKVNTWYTAAEAGCPSGSGSCSITPDYELVDGDGSWKVKAASDTVIAPFSDELTFTVSIDVGNLAPVAGDDAASVPSGASATIDLAANDSDPDGTLDLTSVTIIDNPGHGTIESVNADGTVTYTADAAYNGPDSFTYTIHDDLGLASNTATVTLDIGAPPPTGLVFTGNFDTGLDGWDTKELCCDHSLNLIDTPVRSGAGAARFEIRREDPLIAGANRAELKLETDELETEYWYGWSTMLPTDWVIDTAVEMVAQFHLPAGSGGPPLRFKTDGEELVINTKTLKNGVEVRKKVYSAPIVSSTMKGNWTDFVVNVIWTTADTGHLRIWINGEQVVDEPGSTNFIDTSGPYFKIGVYKTAWRDDKPTLVDTRVIYQDEVRVARGPNGYELVDPANY